MLLFQRIEDLAYKHTDGRRSIGEFLLNEKSHIQKYSMQEIADKTFTSKSSLVRFAKALGFSGWKDFVEAFLGEVYYEETHYTDIDPNFPFQQGDSSHDIMVKLCNLAVDSILDTTDQIDLEQLEKAVDLIAGAGQICLLGMSPNTTVGALFQRKMLSIGRPILLPDRDRGLTVNTLKEGDCAIMVSYSGNNETRPPVQFIPNMKEQGVSIIAITGLGDSLLRQSADCVLSMSSRERLYSKIATFATEESLNFIFNMIYACYFVRNYDVHIQSKITVARRLEEQRYTQYADMRET